MGQIDDVAGCGPLRLRALWALGWTATALGGIDVESQYTVFGAYGALTYSALSGLLLIVVLPRVPTDVGSPVLHRRSP